MIKIYDDDLKQYFPADIEEEVFKVKLKNFIKKDNYYFSIFLLTKINISYKYIDNNILKTLYQPIKKYKEDCLINKDKKICLSILHHLDNSVDVKLAIRFFSLFDLNEKFITELKKCFNYSDIYKYYRNICITVLKEEYEYNELFLIMKLLDNEKLVFQNLFPVFKRISTYASENIVENNIISCSKILKALVVCAPRYIIKKEEYTTSLLSYLVHIFYDSNNFNFISFKETVLLLDTIENITEINFKDTKMLNIAYGIFTDCYNNLEYIVEYNSDKNCDISYIRSSLLEDIVVLVSTIRLITIFYKFSYRLGSRMYDYIEMYKIIEKIYICKIEGINTKEWYFMYNKFISYKYELLDILLEDNNKELPDLSTDNIMKISFNTQSLYRDLENGTEGLNLIQNTNVILNMVDFNMITPLIVDEKRIIYSIDFVTNNKFPNIRLFIKQLAKYNKQEELTLFTFKLIQQYKNIKNREKIICKKSDDDNYVSEFINNINEKNNTELNYQESNTKLNYQENNTELNDQEKDICSKQPLPEITINNSEKEKYDKKTQNSYKKNITIKKYNIVNHDIIIDLYLFNIECLNNNIISKRRNIILDYLMRYCKNKEKIIVSLFQRLSEIKVLNPHIFVLLSCISDGFSKRNIISIFDYLMCIVSILGKKDFKITQRLIIYSISYICIKNDYIPELNKIINKNKDNMKINRNNTSKFHFMIIMIFLISRKYLKSKKMKCYDFIIKVILECTEEERVEIKNIYFNNDENNMYLENFNDFLKEIDTMR
ncbi:hypothetical protein SLOPH_2279 [Spraguea lophii 42_110]|uniref:Uncharacterized protein n=1 Tax=Spraguea lophii (strain 42_110) TaxID=1358809 RepID=S7W8N4_SPRLO|nr:hypothetical protein SLOPH_2279 [Spraguea lophii 42_110]